MPRLINRNKAAFTNILAIFTVTLVMVMQFCTPIVAAQARDCTKVNITPVTKNNIDCASIYGDYSQWDPFDAICASGITPSQTTQVNVTGSNAKVAFLFLKANGFSDAQAAGIVGNLDWESGGVTPTKHQVGGGGGYGIAQWTPPTAMINWVTAAGGDPNALGGNKGQIGQLDYLMHDLNTNDTQARDTIKKDTTVDAAASDFMNLYERPKKSTANLATRIQYGKQVLTAFGGQSSSGITGTTAGGCATATGSISGCVNPFSKITGLSPERIDMGVDYSAPAGSPILAMCNAKILGAASGGTGWVSPTNTQAGVYLKLTSGPYAGKTYYVAEDITPTVKTGDTVKAGDVIAKFKQSPTGIETGWGSGTPYGALAARLNQECTNGDPGCWASAAGVSFNKFLIQTGAKSGVYVSGAPHQNMPPGYP